jgi:hypothetical protein
MIRALAFLLQKATLIALSASLSFLKLFIFKANEQRSFFYSKQSSGTTYKQNVQLRTIHQSRKDLKECTTGYARFYGYANARNAESGTKVKETKLV